MNCLHICTREKIYSSFKKEGEKNVPGRGSFA
jgi:hypothetical protein